MQYSDHKRMKAAILTLNIIEFKIETFSNDKSVHTYVRNNNYKHMYPSINVSKYVRQKLTELKGYIDNLVITV